tara:strand:+ start:1374 stop:2069 length:696 start_codon:yes stop_codon:yes gene_type:complete
MAPSLQTFSKNCESQDSTWCEEIAKREYHNVFTWGHEESVDDYPSGCYLYQNKYIYFNNAGPGREQEDSVQICPSTTEPSSSAAPVEIINAMKQTVTENETDDTELHPCYDGSTSICVTCADVTRTYEDNGWDYETINFKQCNELEPRTDGQEQNTHFGFWDSHNKPDHWSKSSIPEKCTQKDEGIYCEKRIEIDPDCDVNDPTNVCFGCYGSHERQRTGCTLQENQSITS